jgi:hypothetical protein
MPSRLGSTNLPSRAIRRHSHTLFIRMPCRFATAFTVAPSTRISATIRAFTCSGQRLHLFRPATAPTTTCASISEKLNGTILGKNPSNPWMRDSETETKIGRWSLRSCSYTQVSDFGISAMRAPSTRSARRERPRHRTVVPGGASDARSR